jgi:bifunctional non-homologous end joining protein LigD
MAVEDHPPEYGGFEDHSRRRARRRGWRRHGDGLDRGTGEPESPEVDTALRDDDLKFTLNGTKVNGSWVLVRTKGMGGRSFCLLIKHKDRYASGSDIVTVKPKSRADGGPMQYCLVLLTHR